jgi:hypothetical protein
MRGIVCCFDEWDFVVMTSDFVAVCWNVCVVREV